MVKVSIGEKIGSHWSLGLTKESKFLYLFCLQKALLTYVSLDPLLNKHCSLKNNWPFAQIKEKKNRVWLSGDGLVPILYVYRKLWSSSTLTSTSSSCPLSSSFFSFTYHFSNVLPLAAVSALPGNSFKMQILKPHPRPTDSETPGGGAQHSGSTGLPGDSVTDWSLRTIALKERW